MDLMEIRRGLLMAMAKGSDVIKGTFAPTGNGSITINFGKTLNRYIAYFEMDEESKDALASEWTTGSRSFGCIAISWDGCESFEDIDINYTMRYSGTTTPTNGYQSVARDGMIEEFDTDHINVRAGQVSSGVNLFYNGYTYNYMIIPID